MRIVKESGKFTINPTLTTTIHEFDTQNDQISGAVAEINGRYPESGFALNEESKELVYVISGNGKLITVDQETELSKGDVIFLDSQEKFAWLGNMVIFMATTPKFDPDHHKIV